MTLERFVLVRLLVSTENNERVCGDSLNLAFQVAPLPGKAPGSGLEVFVQGKQSKVVIDYLLSKGIQKKWIELVDLSGKK